MRLLLIFLQKSRWQIIDKSLKVFSVPKSFFSFFLFGYFKIRDFSVRVCNHKYFRLFHKSKLTLFLLLLSFSVQAQILPGFGFGQTKRSVPVDNTVYETFDIDDAIIGTGYNQITYTGAEWYHNTNKQGAYQTTYSFSNVDDYELEVKFIGPKVQLYGNKYPSHGIAGVSIDGGSETMVDFYAAAETFQSLVYTSPTLTNAEHTITIRVDHTKNASSSDYWVEIDKIRVTQTADTPPPPTPLDGNWFVATPANGGSDSNPGTTGSRFATISKAVSVAGPGDVIVVGNGTYRETVTPPSGTAGNPITIQAENHGMAIISGLNVVNTSWTSHDLTGGKSIYKTTITLPQSSPVGSSSISTPTTIIANQIFQDGVMQIQARWPNAVTTEEILDRSKLRYRGQVASGGGSWTSGGTLTDAFPNTFSWAGAKIFITGWFVASTKTINSHTINTNVLTHGGTSDQRYFVWYYLFGKLGALDVAKEWHYESGVLYFWQNGGGSPTGTIEYKARNYAFDLSNKSYVSIVGLKFKGCEVNGNTSTSNIVIDGIIAEHTNHTTLQEGTDQVNFNAGQTGFKLLGSNNVIKNSHIKYAASQGIWLGPSCRAENNLIEYISYEGNYGAPISLYGSSDNQVITKNTINYCGRSALDYGPSYGGCDSGCDPLNPSAPKAGATHLNVTVSYNDIYSWGALSSDGGALYAARYLDLRGTRIHHNWIHNSLSLHATGLGPTEQGHSFDTGINAGIYYDQATGSGTYQYFNVMWANSQADLHINTRETTSRQVNRGKAYVYNNTLATQANTTNGYLSYLNVVTSPLDHVRNNIFRDHAYTNYNESPPAGDVANSVYRAGISGGSSDAQVDFDGGHTNNPINVTDPQDYFQIGSGSVARGVGTAITGINEEDSGAKDAGAYPYLGTKWIPGCTGRAGCTTP